MKSRELTKNELVAQANLKKIWDEKAKSLGLTQQSLADEWDCTQGYVSNMINGHAAVTVVYAMMFAKALKVDARDIHPDLEGLAESMARNPWSGVEAERLIELYRAASAPARQAAVLVLYADVEHSDNGRFIQNLLPEGILKSDQERRQIPE